MAVETIFQRADLSAPALINPTDTTEKIKDFPEIAFFQSRVGAPACVVGFEEAVAMGAEQFVLFGSCGVLDDRKSERRVPFIQFLYGADNLGDSTWEIRDLMQYGLDGAEKYMALAFECGIAMKKNLNTQSVL